jgi:hypothetical protein
MHINDIQKASALISQRDALKANIDHLLSMAELIVSGNTSCQIAVHICDNDKKQQQADEISKKEALDRLNDNDGPVVLSNPLDMRRFIQEERERIRTGMGHSSTCMDFHESSDPETTVRVIMAVVNIKKEALKNIYQELKDMNVKLS